MTFVILERRAALSASRSFLVFKYFSARVTPSKNQQPQNQRLLSMLPYLKIEFESNSSIKLKFQITKSDNIKKQNL